MGSLSPLHWVIIAVVVLLVFGGRGKLSGLMGDAAKGIRAFRDGLKSEDAPTPGMQRTATLRLSRPQLTRVGAKE